MNQELMHKHDKATSKNWPSSAMVKDKGFFPPDYPKQCPCGHRHLSWSSGEEEVYCLDCNQNYPLEDCFRSEIEKRQNPRISVNWPAKLEYVQGSIVGKVKDISVDSLFILLSEDVEFGRNFPIVVRPSEQRAIAVVGTKIWTTFYDIDDRSVLGMAVRFIYISPEDRQFIATLVEKERKD